MRWSYDARVNALYVHLRDGQISRTVETAYGAVDVDADGNVLGLEVLALGAFDVRAVAQDLHLDEDATTSLAFLQAGLGTNVLRLASHVVATEPEAAPSIETSLPYVLQECTA